MRRKRKNIGESQRIPCIEVFDFSGQDKSQYESTANYLRRCYNFKPTPETKYA